jgi:hypothetical protein
VKHPTRSRLFLLLLGAAACTGGPGAPADPVTLEKTLLPSLVYTVDAFTESSSAIEILRMPGLADTVRERHTASSRSRQVLGSGALADGLFPLRLETLAYQGTDDGVSRAFEMGGVIGHASFDPGTRMISLLELEGECRDSLLTRDDVGGYLLSAYQAIQGSLLDSARTFVPGQSDTLSGRQLHPMGPLNMTLLEHSVFTLERVSGDSAWFAVDRWAELVPDSIVTAGNTVVEGRGSGTMVYLVSRKYVVDTRLTTELKVTHTGDSLAFVATSGSVIEVSTDIGDIKP